MPGYAGPHLRFTEYHLDSLPEMEPFDEVLNHQVYALEEERLLWEATISDYRRNGPRDLRDLTEGILVHEQGTAYESDPMPPETNPPDFEDAEREHIRFWETPGERSHAFFFFQAALDNLAEIEETHRRVMEKGKRVLEVRALCSTLMLATLTEFTTGGPVSGGENRKSSCITSGARKASLIYPLSFNCYHVETLGDVWLPN